MTTFDTPKPITLSIELDAGEVVIDSTVTETTEVELRPLRSGDAEAEALIAGAQIEHRGDSVVVHLPGGRSLGMRRHAPGIAVAVRIPVGSTLAAKLRSADMRVTGELEQVKVDAASGDVRLSDISGSAVVVGASGNVRIASIGGDLKVTTASGDVAVQTACGDCSIQSASGDVTLGVVEGDLGVKTASGHVTVRTADGSVRARTASGDVELGRVRTGRTEIDAVSGDVKVGVERGIAVWLDVASLSGGVHSTLQPTDAAAGGAKTLQLRVQTVSGHVELAAV